MPPTTNYSGEGVMGFLGSGLKERVRNWWRGGSGEVNFSEAEWRGRARRRRWEVSREAILEEGESG